MMESLFVSEAEIEGDASSDEEEDEDAERPVKRIHCISSDEDSSDGEEHARFDLEHDTTREECEQYLNAFKSRTITGIEDKFKVRTNWRPPDNNKQRQKKPPPPAVLVSKPTFKRSREPTSFKRRPGWMKRPRFVTPLHCFPPKKTTVKSVRSNGQKKKTEGPSKTPHMCTRLYCKNPRVRGKFLCIGCEKKSKIDKKSIAYGTTLGKKMYQVVCNRCTAMNDVKRIFDPFTCVNCGAKNERVIQQS